MKQYAWRKHGMGTCSAQAAGEMIEMIEARDGFCSKQALLDESRPEDSPTHGAFEWDDTKAAEQFRLAQAGRIINNICVKIISDDAPKQEKRVAFVNVTPEGTHTRAIYKSAEIAMTNKEEKDNVLKNALDELTAFKEKYRRLSELAAVFAAIDEVERKYK